MKTLHDTQPNLRAVRPNAGGPPRLLLFGVIGFCLLIIMGAIAVPIIFREVLSPAQRSRIMEQLPFMEAFQRPTPMGGILPTVGANPELENSAMDLLNMAPISATATADPLNSVVPTATLAPATQVPTLQPTATVAATDNAVPATEEAAVQSVAMVPLSTVAPDVSSEAFNVAQSLPGAGSLPNFKIVKQTWNNCGPATLTMTLGYYGWQQDQKYAESVIRPTREDKNVSPYELVDFVNTQTGVRALTRVGGDIDLLKRLIVAQFPLLIETSAMFEAYDWIGHYRLIVGYDDNSGQLFAFDTFQGVGPDGRGVPLGYINFDNDWQDFNRTFIVVYQQEREAELMQLLGTRATDLTAAEHAFEVAQQEAKANPQDSFAWFNMGTSLTIMGRYEEASNAFDLARLHEVPWRILWYQFGPFEAYYQVGRYDDIVSLAGTNLNTARDHEESYYWRGMAYAAKGLKGEAAAEFRMAISLRSNFTAARDALQILG